MLKITKKKLNITLPVKSMCKLQNEPCESKKGINNVVGQCFTASECKTEGGEVIGQCAAGFGVCCSFSVSTCSAVVDRVGRTLEQRALYT